MAFVVIAAALDLILGPLVALIPMGMGVQEGATAAIFASLGSTLAFGIQVALVRRIRGLLVTAIGLTVMLVAQAVDARRHGHGT